MLRSIPADPIFQAAANGDVAAIKACLVSNPAAVSLRDPTEQTIPILYAAAGEHTAAVQCLLDAGSPVDYIDIPNKRVLLDFVPKTKTGKEIKHMIGKKMRERFRDTLWRVSLSDYDESKALAALLLNMIIYDAKMHIFNPMLTALGNNLFTKLAGEISVLRIHYPKDKSVKEWADFLIFMSHVCARRNAIKHAIDHNTAAVNTLDIALMRATSDVERSGYIATLIDVYKDLLTLLQSDKTPLATVKALGSSSLDIHDGLQSELDKRNPWPEAFVNQMVAFDAAKTAYLAEYIRLCVQSGTLQEVFKCYNRSIKFETNWFEERPSDENKLSALIPLANLYKQLLGLLQNDLTAAGAIKTIRENMVIHDRLRGILTAFEPSTPALTERLAQLNRSIAAVFEEYNKPRAQEPVEAAAPAIQPEYTPRHFSSQHRPPRLKKAKPPVSILKKREHSEIYTAAPHAASEPAAMEGHATAAVEDIEDNTPSVTRVRFTLR